MKALSVNFIKSMSLRPTMPLIIAIPLMVILLGMEQSRADAGYATQVKGFAEMESMGIEEMAQARAREGDAIINLTTVKSVQNLKASVTDTSFDIGGDMVSGNISFAPDALGSYSGTGIFSAVTGNGNSINNAVGISVFIAN